MHRLVAIKRFGEFARIQRRLVRNRKCTHPVQVPIHRRQMRSGHKAFRAPQKCAPLARFGHQRDERSDQTVAHEARDGVVTGGDAGAPVALITSQHFIAAVAIERHGHVLTRHLGHVVGR